MMGRTKWHRPIPIHSVDTPKSPFERDLAQKGFGFIVATMKMGPGRGKNGFFRTLAVIRIETDDIKCWKEHSLNSQDVKGRYLNRSHICQLFRNFFGPAGHRSNGISCVR